MAEGTAESGHAWHAARWLLVAAAVLLLALPVGALLGGVVLMAALLGHRGLLDASRYGSVGMAAWSGGAAGLTRHSQCAPTCAR